MKKIMFCLFCLIFFISCHRYSNKSSGQYLYFEGISNKEALLSKIVQTSSGKKNIIPIERIYTNTKIILPSGHYLLSNDCSSYEFTHDENSAKRIFLSHMQINLADNWKTDGNKLAKNEELKDDNQVVQSICYNVLNQKEYTSLKKLQFDILPGKNNIFISGKNLEFNIKPDLFENLTVDLASLSLSLSSWSFDHESSHFYVIPQNEKKKVVAAAPINGKIWLFPGQYLVEVNGTKKNINLQSKSNMTLQLGMLKVAAPKNFPFTKRLQLGGQPIAAYIDNKVLLRLNVSYPVFPGKYTLNLEESDLEKEIHVEENATTSVRTLGAQIDAPACRVKGGSCQTPSRITVHENKLPFILMVVPVGQPFLVFENNSYQYGVEGIKGVFKTLPASSDSIKSETLGLANMKWEVRYTSSNSTTNFVRFESKSSNLYGKSVDLSFFKPSQVYLPDGDYWLTYYIDDGGSQNTPKTRIEVDLKNGSVKDIVVPIFVHVSKGPSSQSQFNNSQSSSESSTLVPIKK